MMVKKVLWISRHLPHRKQIEALREMYGDGVVVEVEPRPYDDAKNIAQRYREGSYYDMVVVAPLSVVQVLCTMGVKMLWSESAKEDDPKQVDFTARGQGYRFVRFRRIKRIAIEFED